MRDMDILLNADYIDALFQKWIEAPLSVPETWQHFFKGFEFAGLKNKDQKDSVSHEQMEKQSKVEALIYRYRDLGHLMACLDPLSACPTDHPLLNIESFDLNASDLDTPFSTRYLTGMEKTPLRAIIKKLREIYCHSLGAEYMHLQDPAERKWLHQRLDLSMARKSMSKKVKLHILNKLYQANMFEQFLHKKYIGQKRFSIEGAEGIIPMLDHLMDHTYETGVRKIVMGMSHRGRLNILVNILNKPYEKVLSEFEDHVDPEGWTGSGDVKYHKGYQNQIKIGENGIMDVVLMNNPSHLEAVNPVVEGFARACQDELELADKFRVLPVLLHGDAAISGQGITAETLNMSQLEGYKTHGTVHIVINNQIGYTTLPEDARSTRYSTDIAKSMMIPVFHVHGEDPETCVLIMQLACDYRQKFGKDVVIDVVAYRRYGHNEGDEPYFTQPQMYERILNRPPIHEIYTQGLVKQEIVTKAGIGEIQEQIHSCLELSYEQAKSNQQPQVKRFHSNDTGIENDDPVTGVEESKLIELAHQLNTPPSEFRLHRKLNKLLERRLEAVVKDQGVDWTNAEALAFASLLTEGYLVRLSGQDCQRGTFSQRHSVLTDMETGRQIIPLNHLTKNQAEFRVFNSSLSEAGVLGFEYGYSIHNQTGLTIWEAQFGDFANNAQGIIDQFIVSGEAKWQTRSGLILLLPHGYEGQGPEHSSAMLERFLLLCGQENICVCYPSTPSQYFHLFRRQALLKHKKPLVIMTPKSLLRHPDVVSALEQFSTGNFQKIITASDNASTVRKVILCTGKIYYELAAIMAAQQVKDIRIVRFEQLYPFPETEFVDIVNKFQSVKDWVWVQEESQNKGAWRFIEPLLKSFLNLEIAYIGREPSASPSVGSFRLFQQEQKNILENAIV